MFEEIDKLIFLESNLVEIEESLTIIAVEENTDSVIASTREGVRVNLQTLNSVEVFEGDLIKIRGVLRYYQDEYQVWLLKESLISNF